MYRKPENYDLVKEALIKAGRQDLIGFDKKCLIAPRKMDRKGEHQGQRSYGKNDKSKNNSIKNGKNSKNNKVVVFCKNNRYRNWLYNCFHQPSVGNAQFYDNTEHELILEKLNLLFH